MPTYEELVKLAKKYAVSAHLAFTKEGLPSIGAWQKSTKLMLPNWVVAASRTSALYRNYSKERLARRVALRGAEGRANGFGGPTNYPANEECLELPHRWGIYGCCELRKPPRGMASTRLLTHRDPPVEKSLPAERARPTCPQSRLQ